MPESRTGSREHASLVPLAYWTGRKLDIFKAYSDQLLSCRALYNSVKAATTEAGFKMTSMPNPHKVNLERKSLIEEVRTLPSPHHLNTT